jgi:LuxR family maltose regulon positive regulatory protein
MPFFFSPALVIPKVLMATGAPGSRKKVDSCLRQLHAFAKSTHNVRILIEVLALEAMLHASNNHEEKAMAILEKSLALAQPGGFIRLYVDLGNEIAGLLRRLQQRGSFPSYIASILKAFSAAPIDPQPDQALQSIEPMTYRESEILELLARRYSNKEIAAKLVIAPATVKHHTLRIYQKLAVHNRRDAVAAAIAAGLLPPEN